MISIIYNAALWLVTGYLLGTGHSPLLLIATVLFTDIPKGVYGDLSKMRE